MFACKTCLHAAFFKLHINAVISTQSQYKRKVAPRKLQHTPIRQASPNLQKENISSQTVKVAGLGYVPVFFLKSRRSRAIFLFALHEVVSFVRSTGARPLGIDFSRGLPLTCKRLKPGMQGERNEASWALSWGEVGGDFLWMKNGGFLMAFLLIP